MVRAESRLVSATPLCDFDRGLVLARSAVAVPNVVFPDTEDDRERPGPGVGSLGNPFFDLARLDRILSPCRCVSRAGI